MRFLGLQERARVQDEDKRCPGLPKVGRLITSSIREFICFFK